jgi:glycosyltransferase involved in cell wall biosynthesis
LVSNEPAALVLEGVGYKAEGAKVGPRDSKGPFLFLGYLLYLTSLFFRLLRRLKRFRPHFLLSISGHAYSGFVVTLLGKITGVRTILRISEPTRSSVSFKYTFGKIVAAAMKFEETWVLRNCDLLISNRQLVEHYSSDIADRVIVISQGIDSNVFNSKHSSWSPPQERVTIVSVARLSAEKNLHALIDSMKKLYGKYPKLQLKIIGKGPLEDELRTYVKKSGQDETIKFLGFVGESKEVARILRNSHVFVLPSLVEGLPSAMLEAMACGIPVVTAHSWGVQSTDFRDGQHLLICDGTAGGIAAAIAEVLDNPIQTELRIQNALDTVMNKHTASLSRKRFALLLARFSR